MSRRCFLCSVRIGRKHVMYASYFDGRRHVVRLCYGCGMPDFEENGFMARLVNTGGAIDAKLRDIKALEGSGR